MDIDMKGGLKIKGQAEAQKRRSKWEDEGAHNVRFPLVVSYLHLLTIT